MNKIVECLLGSYMASYGEVNVGMSCDFNFCRCCCGGMGLVRYEISKNSMLICFIWFLSLFLFYFYSQPKIGRNRYSLFGIDWNGRPKSLASWWNASGWYQLLVGVLRVLQVWLETSWRYRWHDRRRRRHFQQYHYRSWTSHRSINELTTIAGFVGS